MNIKLKKILIFIAAVISMIACATCGVALSGNWSNFAATLHLKSDVSDSYSDIEGSNPTADNSALSNIMADKPEIIKAVWLKADIDFLVKGQTQQAIKSDVDRICDEIFDMGFNSVFLSCSNNLQPIAGGEEGQTFDVLEYCLKSLNSRGLYVILRLEPTTELSAENYADYYSKIPEFIKKYQAGAYLLPNEQNLFKDKSNDISGDITNAIKSVKSQVPNCEFVIFSPFSAFTSKDNEKYINFISNLMKDKDIQTVYVEPSTSFNDKKINYKSLLEQWRAKTLENGTELIVAQHGDLIGFLQDYENAEEIIYQLSACDKLESRVGTSFISYSVLKNKSIASIDVLLEYIKGNSSVANGLREFTINNHNNTEISTNESKITFSGGGSPKYPIICNGNQIKCTETGDFSLEFDLKLGNNKFVFEHKGKTYTYTVKYTIDLIKDVKPKGTARAPGETVVDISATALKGSQVYAMLGNSKIRMTQGSSSTDSENENYTPNSNSDFVSYFGKFTLPAEKSSSQNLGKIKVYALYESISENVTGATIIVNAAALPPPENTIEKPNDGENEPESGGESHDIPGMVTPYSYAGVSGKSKMVEIKTNYCETMLMNPFNDNSNPWTAPLLAGTFDYVVGESDYGSHSYYNLASGKRIAKEDAKLISSGYNLPSNKINVLSSSTSEGSSNVKLSLKWKAPFTVTLNDQNYGQYYNDKIFGVNNSTATSVDFTFYSTTVATGTVDFSGSNVVSGAKWIYDMSKQTATLRLTLKRSGVFYGYSVSYNSDGTLNIRVKNKPSNNISGFTVMLDPGHGGNDPGAIGVISSGQKYESQMSLSIALKVKNILESKGATVLMTRTSNSEVLIDQRVAMTRSKKPDMFISIHLDSAESSSVIGTSAFYYRPYSYPLASAIHEQIVSCYRTDLYAGESSSKKNAVDRHTQYYAYRVARVEECPSVLIEYGFVSNANECAILQSSAVQTKLAQATVNGIIDYINKN